MSREWTEKHILELIQKNPDFSAGSGKQDITKMLETDTGLELTMSASYPVFLSGNMTFFYIDIPERTVLLTPRFAEMLAGAASLVAPVELTININSPFAEIPADGLLGHIMKTPPAVFQVIGGWMDSTTLTSTPDSNLLYPRVEVPPTVFNNLTDDDGHMFHIVEEAHTIWLSATDSMDVEVYRVSVDGLTAWPANGFHLHTEIPIGGAS